MAWASSAVLPTTSKAWCTPARHSDLTAATGSKSSPSASTKSVAPNSRASASLAATRSMAMMAEAPTSRAAWMTLSPTPPAPITATVSPICTLARLNTAPVPVTTPQPISAAAARGISAGTGMHWFSPTTTCWAKAPMLAKL